MKKPLYVKLDDQKKYTETLKDLKETLEKIDSKVEEIETLRQKEKDYLSTWKEKSESVREDLKTASEILSIDS